MGSHLSGKQTQNTLYLASFLDYQLPQGISQPHGNRWFHENGGAGVGNVVDDSLDIVQALHLDQDNVAPLPFRDNIFLKYAFAAG